MLGINTTFLYSHLSLLPLILLMVVFLCISYLRLVTSQYAFISFLTVNFLFWLKFEFNGSFVIWEGFFSSSSFVLFSQLILLVFLILVSFLRVNESNRETEFLILSLGMALYLLVELQDLLLFYLLLEVLSLSLYVMVGSRFASLDTRSSEASIKYAFLSAISSGLFLFGLGLIYGWDGTTSLAFLSPESYQGQSLVILALLFKLGSFPFHNWVPDVYEGSLLSVATLFAVVPKLVYLLFLFSFTMASSILILGIILGSIILGGLWTWNQTRTRRILAYSGVGHVGFLLLPVWLVTEFSPSLLLFYYFLYSLTVWLLFTSLRGKDRPFLVQWLGKWKINWAISVLLMLGLFSLAGVPPLGGFFIKWLIFVSVIDSNQFIFAFLILVLTLFATYYSIRLILWVRSTKSLSIYWSGLLDVLDNPYVFSPVLFTLISWGLYVVSSYGIQVGLCI